MPHELIDLEKWPSMPAPWSSVDAGEAWVWGDYVALFQTKPILVVEKIAQVIGQKGIGVAPIQYPFAMTVFYRKDRNPHGPSSCPIMVATLERIDYAAATKAMGAHGIDLGNTKSSNAAPVFKSLFTAGARFNLGEFEGELSRDSARAYFLDLLSQQLSQAGKPVKIGVISDVHGHPQTGWPAQSNKKAAGCLAVAATLLAIVTPLVFWLIHIYN